MKNNKSIVIVTEDFEVTVGTFFSFSFLQFHSSSFPLSPSREDFSMTNMSFLPVSAPVVPSRALPSHPTAPVESVVPSRRSPSMPLPVSQGRKVMGIWRGVAMDSLMFYPDPQIGQPVAVF
jgi:hypothetical protein